MRRQQHQRRVRFRQLMNRVIDLFNCLSLLSLLTAVQTVRYYSLHFQQRLLF